MKNFILGFISSMLIIYLLASFHQLSINPSTWTENARSVFVIAGTIISLILGATYAMFNELTEDNKK